MISRRDDAGVVDATSRRSNKEISHFFASRRAGEFGQASVLLVAHVPYGTHRSSRLESCPNSLRSIDSSLNPALLSLLLRACLALIPRVPCRIPRRGLP